MENLEEDFNWKRAVKFGSELVKMLEKGYRSPYTFKLVKVKYGKYYSLGIYLGDENIFSLASEVKIIFGSGTRIKTYYDTIDKTYQTIIKQLA